MVCMVDFLGVEIFGVLKHESHMQIKGQCVYVKNAFGILFALELVHQELMYK